MKKILYSLLFIYSSVFAYDLQSYNGYSLYSDNGNAGPMDSSAIVSSLPAQSDTTNYDFCNRSGYINSGKWYYTTGSTLYTLDRVYDHKNNQGYDVCLSTTHYNSFTLGGSCPVNTVKNPDTLVCEAPLITCSDTQVDINGTCQDISLSSDFPTSEEKGTPSIREDDTSKSDCIPGTEFHSGIAYAKIIGWNSSKNKCEIGAFFCNSGLTWDNVSMSCKIPDSEAQLNPSDGDISQALADSCKSGKWAKKWTYDYCNQPLCYIPLDAQNYNLSCGNKYLEYDCTSDYRIKKFVQVSCGDVAKKDYNNTSLLIGGDTSTSDVVPDPTQNLATTDSVVSAINSQSSKLTSSLDGLKNTLDTINQKSDSTNNKLDSISNQLSNLNDKLSPLKKVDDLSNDSSSIANLMNNSIDNGFNTYLNRDYTGGLATSQCGSIGTYSINFHGSTITILSQNTINELPMSIFKTMIIFAFVFSGVIIAFRGV